MNETHYEFDAEKNRKLKRERGIGFDDAMFAIENGGLIDVIPHPNRKKYAHQEVYIVEIKGYVYLMPFVRKNSAAVFLKTLYPSRKAKKEYTGGDDAEN